MTVFEAITLFLGLGFWSAGLVWALRLDRPVHRVVVKGRRFSG